MLPGYANGDDLYQLKKLSIKKIHMFVGEKDQAFLEPMKRTVNELEKLGATVHFTISAHQGHVFGGLTGDDLYQVLYASRIYPIFW